MNSDYFDHCLIEEAMDNQKQVIQKYMNQAKTIGDLLPLLQVILNSLDAKTTQTLYYNVAPITAILNDDVIGNILSFCYSLQKKKKKKKGKSTPENHPTNR
eukprot:477359_1